VTESRTLRDAVVVTEPEWRRVARCYRTWRVLSLTESLGWIIDALASNVADMTTPSRCLLGPGR